MNYAINILTCCLVAFQLSSCVTTKAFENAAYISNDAVYIKNEKLTEVSLFAISDAADKAMYENIVSSLQAAFLQNKIGSNIYFLSALESADIIRSRIKESDKPYQLIINPVKDNYQRDEMNNPFISKQMTFFLQKITGERIADISISIDKNEKEGKLGNEISSLVFAYLKKKNLLN